MSFYSDNENFINIKLHHYMKGLSDGEKLIKYESIKPETRKRLKKAYLSSENIFEFYEQAFEYLSFFELEFLVVNLFFEKECDNIFNYLIFGILSKLEIDKRLLFPYKFIDFMRKNSSENQVGSFLKQELTELLSLEQNDWDSLNTNQNSIVKKYASWLVTSGDIKVNNFSYLLLCKIWNHYEKYKEGFETKAIVLYDSINKEFDELIKKEVYLNLYEIITEIEKSIKDILLKDLNYYPIIDKQIQSDKNYNKHRTRFNNNIELSKFLYKSYNKESFISLFEMMIGKDHIYNGKLKKEINNKLNNLELPNDKEILDIVYLNLEGRQDKIRYDFLKRLYIF